MSEVPLHSINVGVFPLVAGFSGAPPEIRGAPKPQVLKIVPILKSSPSSTHAYAQWLLQGYLAHKKQPELAS